MHFHEAQGLEDFCNLCAPLNVRRCLLYLPCLVHELDQLVDEEFESSVYCLEIVSLLRLSIESLEEDSALFLQLGVMNLCIEIVVKRFLLLRQ